MIVLFERVANHTAWDHPWIANKSWYKQDDAGHLISPPKTGLLNVAALNYDNMDMRNAMIDAMRYWGYQANIDGYRCDAADFIPAGFWQQASYPGFARQDFVLVFHGLRSTAVTLSGSD